MTASQRAKSLGLNNLKQVSEHFGVKSNGHPVVSCNTLGNWYRDKPKLFHAVLIGVRELEGV